MKEVSEDDSARQMIFSSATKPGLKLRELFLNSVLQPYCISSGHWNLSFAYKLCI